MAPLKTIRIEAVQQLTAAGIEAAALEVDMMLEAIIRQPRAWIMTHGDFTLNDAQQAQFISYIERRKQYEPMAYILGEREFYGRTFKTVPGVLIPRPDTETVITAVQSLFAPDALETFAEVGVGTGAIAVTLLSEYPKATAMGTDISYQALACAEENAKRHHVASRLKLCEASLLEGVEGPLDLVVSNPPYIPTADIATLDKTVQLFEPHLALDGGDDGLVLYRQLVPQAYGLLKTGGWCVLEHGYNQAADLAAIFAAAGFKAVVSFKDLGNHIRVTAAQKG